MIKPGMSLSEKMKLVGFVEQWCKAVRSQVEAQLLSGMPVEGFKIVRGKKGNSQWVDETKAETVLKSMRLSNEEMYNMDLISPTSAKKLFKNQPKRLARISADGMITQSDGALSVAPEDDARAAVFIAPAADDFDNLEECGLL